MSLGIFLSPVGFALCLGQLRTNSVVSLWLFVRVQSVAQHWNSQILPILRSAGGWRDLQASAASLFIGTIARSFGSPAISETAKAHIHKGTWLIEIFSFWNDVLLGDQPTTTPSLRPTPPSPPLGAVPHRVHLHRDRHDVLAVRRRLLLWVCQLQRLRGDGSSPNHLLPQPAHQGAARQLEPDGEFKGAARWTCKEQVVFWLNERASLKSGCLAHVVGLLLQVGNAKIAGISQQESCKFNSQRLPGPYCAGFALSPNVWCFFSQ